MEVLEAKLKPVERTGSKLTALGIPQNVCVSIDRLERFLQSISVHQVICKIRKNYVTETCVRCM
jgi:hypothetical protein